MRRLLTALAFLFLASAASAQSTKADLSVQIDQSIFPNTTGQVTPKAANALFHALLNAMCGLAQASDCPLPSSTFILGTIKPGNVPVASVDGAHIQDSGMRGLKSFIDSVAPGPCDNDAMGYAVGSPGTNTTAPGVEYKLTALTPPNTQCNASWSITNIAPPATYVGTVPPSRNKDSGQGFSVGSPGVNTANGDRYSARSVIVGAAVWALSGSPAPNYLAGNWYLARGHDVLIASTPVGSTTTVVLAPFIATETVTISTVGSKINAAGSSTYRMAIYATSPTTNLPTGAALATTGDISDTVTGVQNGALNINLPLDPGVYWEAIEVNDLTVAFIGPNTALTGSLVGNATQNQVTGGAGVNTTNCVSTPSAGYGVFPDLTSATITMQPNTRTCGLLTFLVASVP